MPYLPAELATLESDNIRFCVGSAECGRHHNAVFSLTDLKNDILLSVYWGGPKSQKPQGKIQPIEDACGNIKFSERVSSQRGGEGYDFYIIDITGNAALRTAVDKCLAERIQITNEAMKRFAKKYDVIGRFRVAYDAYAERYRDLANAAHDYLKRVQKNEYLWQNYFVAFPEFLLELPDVIEPNFDFSQDLHELQRLYLLVEHTTFESVKASIEESLENWEEFMPKYAKLYGPVVKKCHGRLLINGSKAIVSLPGREDVEAYLEHVRCKEFEYDFNEIELGHCLKMISDRVAKEQEAKAKNQELLSKLVAE